jgi:hypothetical protein
VFPSTLAATDILHGMSALAKNLEYAFPCCSLRLSMEESADVLTQGISVIVIHQLPTFYVFRKVHTVFISKCAIVSKL